MSIHTGKCPNCEKIMHYMVMQGVDAKVLMGHSWRAVSYQCPHCHTVVGVEIDPIALKAELVEQIAKRLGR